MKYFLDTEFIEDGVTIDLISIGIVAEDGRELYCQNIASNLFKADDWVRANVLPHLADKVNNFDLFHNLKYNPPQTMYPTEIKGAILKFCSVEEFGKPEFWGYYADYDWVVFCQLFGKMIDLPKGWPMYCNDIKQLCTMIGNPKLSDQGKGEHHALADARWNKLAWEFCMAQPDMRGYRGNV